MTSSGVKEYVSNAHLSSASFPSNCNSKFSKAEVTVTEESRIPEQQGIHPLHSGVATANSFDTSTATDPKSHSVDSFADPKLKDNGFSFHASQLKCPVIIEIFC